MSERADADAVADARQLRTEAWTLVRGDVDRLRSGLDSRPIPQRIKDKATEEVADAIGQARDVANENKAVVAGTVLALAGWFLRAPIAVLANRLLARWQQAAGTDEGDAD